MKQTGRIALGGLLAALALVCMALTAFSWGTFLLPALAGIVLIPYVVEAGPRRAWLLYAAVGLLSLWISPSRSAQLFFIVFFGYYPILKCLLERLRRRWLEWTLKFAVFNLSFAGAFALLTFAFSLPVKTVSVGGISITWLLPALGNLACWLYDRALSDLVGQYMRRLHPQVARMFRLR